MRWDGMQKVMCVGEMDIKMSMQMQPSGDDEVCVPKAVSSTQSHPRLVTQQRRIGAPPNCATVTSHTTRLANVAPHLIISVTQELRLSSTPFCIDD